MSIPPSIEEWTRIASIAPTLKNQMKNLSKDYNFEYGLYSKQGAPDYRKCIESYLKMFEDDEIWNSDKV